MHSVNPYLASRATQLTAVALVAAVAAAPARNAVVFDFWGSR